MPFLEGPAGRLWYEAVGDGPAVLLLHSALVDSRVWDPQVEALSPRFRVVRMDFRMFGRSDPPAAPYSSMDDVAAVLDACGIDRAAVIGSSAGGAIELEFAVQHPGRVAALVTVGAGIIGFHAPDERRDLMEKHVEEALASEGVAAAQRIELEFWAPSGAYPDSDARLWEIAQGAGNVYLIEDDPDRPPETPTVERLEEIAAPTLVVVADDDAAGIRAAAEELGRRVPAARVVRMPGDHLPAFRRPQEFHAIVLPFLEEVMG
jgi:3-oxoadipate enol-lactonase